MEPGGAPWLRPRLLSEAFAFGLQTWACSLSLGDASREQTQNGSQLNKALSGRLGNRASVTRGVLPAPVGRGWAVRGRLFWLMAEVGPVPRYGGEEGGWEAAGMQVWCWYLPQIKDRAGAHPTARAGGGDSSTSVHDGGGVVPSVCALGVFARAST